jgi:hypothetical protein
MTDIDVLQLVDKRVEVIQPLPLDLKLENSTSGKGACFAT